MMMRKHRFFFLFTPRFYASCLMTFGTFDDFLFDFCFQSLNKTFFTPTDLVKFVFSKKFLLNKKKRALKLISSDLIALKTETITPRKQTWQLFKTKGERE